MTQKNKTTDKKTVKKQPIVNKKEQKEELRKIKPKNYLILTGIFAITLILVILLRYWYISYRNYQLTIPVLRGTLNEVTIAELDHYITANPDAVIYIEVSDDENSRDVAKELKDIVKERNLANKVVYVNISSVKNKNEFLDNFSKKYSEGKKIENYPVLALFIDGKVDAYVSRTNKQRLNIGDVAQIFDQYELEGDN